MSLMRRRRMRRIDWSSRISIMLLLGVILSRITSCDEEEVRSSDGVQTGMSIALHGACALKERYHDTLLRGHGSIHCMIPSHNHHTH